MKWTKTPTPRIGDTRTRDKFAWLPTKLSDDVTTVWLGWYQVKEECVSGYYPLAGYLKEIRWVVIELSLRTPGFPDFKYPCPPPSTPMKIRSGGPSLYSTYLKKYSESIVNDRTLANNELKLATSQEM